MTACIEQLPTLGFMKKYIGIDLGGTNLRAGIVDLTAGTVIALKSVPTLAREGHEAVMQRMVRLIWDLLASNNLEKEDVVGIGIGLPGVLDLEKGTTLFLPNLSGTWPNVPIRDTIAAQTGIPTAILNDARAITYGEWKFGAGCGVATMACFTLGTGIGGGLVINGQLHLGIGGTAGELGHQTIDINGPLCSCGNHGCLECYASGPAIATMGIKAVKQGFTTSIGQMVNYDLNRITPEVIAEAARAGDPIAREIYNQVGRYLGIAIGNLLVSIGPRKVVIAGGVSAAGELLLEPIRDTLREQVHVMPLEQVEIVLARLGSNAGVLGVALWSHQKLAGV